ACRGGPGSVGPAHLLHRHGATFGEYHALGAQVLGLPLALVHHELPASRADAPPGHPAAEPGEHVADRARTPLAGVLPSDLRERSVRAHAPGWDSAHKIEHVFRVII